MRHLRITIAAIILGILLSAGVAYTACTTTTYIINGQIMTCVTCCFGSHCTVNCF